MSIKILDAPKIKQRPQYCGIACLDMALSYFGLEISQEDTAQYFKNYKEIEKNMGVYTSELVSVAKKLGFKATYWEKLGLEDIIEFIDKNSPIIALGRWLKDPYARHFILIKGYDNKKRQVFVNDPDDLRKNRFDYDKFKKLWITKGKEGTNRVGIIIASRT